MSHGGNGVLEMLTSGLVDQSGDGYCTKLSRDCGTGRWKLSIREL